MLKLNSLVPQAAVMSPSVDPSMSMHPTAMITQQMGQLSLGNTGAVRGINSNSHQIFIFNSPVRYNSVAGNTMKC